MPANSDPTGTGTQVEVRQARQEGGNGSVAVARARSSRRARKDIEPDWYKDAVIYEVRVRSFYDSDGDGIGDLRGLTEKLDYLADLGVNALWLLPICPSPLRDDGYDIADYRDVHPEVGNLADFKAFLKAAHARNLRVITELVLNHTSDQHPWFQRARRAPPGSKERDFYVWSDTADRYREARIIFKDFEPSNWTWDPVAKAYYWHRFYANQPDLNYESPHVQKAMLQVVDFWFGMGVDGMRLDAVPYLFEREGTNCENLPEGHDFLRKLRRHIDQRFTGRMLLSEANQWPEDAVAYFGQGDETHMAFHFPIMPRLFMAIQTEDRLPIVDILEQTPAIPEPCQWALFLRNHDELTLEMVTDEERDYMYRVYAQQTHARVNLGIRRRLAPLLSNDRDRIELMKALLFSLPGTPVLYYGDEIGMGDNFYLGDRNGVRTPMQWSGDRNAGFSRANPQQLILPVIIDPEYHYETINVEAQQKNPQSLLWWMKRLIALRKQYRAFGRGSMEILHPTNHHIFAYVRRDGAQTVLCVYNLSRFPQPVELDLAPYRGRVPVEMFGRTQFGVIGERPYGLTLGGHAFYWFSLEPHAPGQVRSAATELPSAQIAGDWTDLCGDRSADLEAALPRWMTTRRWFGAKAREIKRARLVEALKLPSTHARLCVVALEYADGGEESFCVPLAFAEGKEGAEILRASPDAVLLRVGGGCEGVIYDGMRDGLFARGLLASVRHRRRLRGTAGELVATPAPALRKLWEHAEELPVRPLEGEQSNSSVQFGDRFMLKLVRRIDSGENPELELGRFLTVQRSFPHVPPLLGYVEYDPAGGAPAATLAVLHARVASHGDAWQYTQDWLKRFLEQALAEAFSEVPADLATGKASLLQLARLEPPKAVQDLLGSYLPSAELLGRRTAELHVVLGSATDDPHLVPEVFGTLYQRSLYQSMRNLTKQIGRQLRHAALPDAVRDELRRLGDFETRVLGRMRAMLERRLGGMRIRVHGDYHLGQVLYTGRDFVILDFEGEPMRSLGERRIKRSPLRDVAGMLRSFHYAAYAALPGYGTYSTARLDDLALLEPWARFWYAWSGARFLRGYLDVAEVHPLLPAAQEERELLIELLMLEKAVYELGYELNNRPTWLRIPLQAIHALLEPH